VRVVVATAMVGAGLVGFAGSASAASPDGLIAYTRQLLGPPQSFVVRTVNPVTGAQAWAGSGSTPAWSPDGTQLAFVNGSNKLVIKGPGGLRYTGVDADGLSQSSGAALSWSSDGRHIAYGHAESVWVVNSTPPYKPHQVSPGLGFGPSWSPDSQRLVYSALDLDLHVVNADGTGDTDVTNSAVDEAFPAWSPDGASFAYVSTGNGQPGVYVSAANGTGAHLVAASLAQLCAPAWAPSGTQLAYANHANGNLQVWVVNVDGTNPHAVATLIASFQPAWQRTS